MEEIEEAIRVFTLRLSPKEHEILERGAHEQGVSKNKFMQKLLYAYDKNSSPTTDLQKRVEALEKGLEEVKKSIKK